MLICLVILVLAGAGWMLFVPGAEQTLAGFGITLPAVAGRPAGQQVASIDPQAPAGQRPGAAPGGGRPGGAGGFGGGRGRMSSVVTSAVTMATINDSLAAIGQGNAVRSVTVGALSGGTLQDLLVAPGDKVTAGQIIGRLDADTEQIDFDIAKLAVADADATLTRNQDLARSNLVASSALATVQLAADNARLELRNAEVALRRRTITSPIAGTVGLMQVTPGNYLSAQTVVTTIEDASSVLVDFWVPERYAAAIDVGMPVTATATALPGRSFDGLVSAVDNRIDPESRTLQIQARIPNDDNAVRPGMSFSVALQFVGEQFPAVSPLSIQWSAEGSYVWAYVDGKAHKVMAEIVQRNSDGVLVRGDLKPGDAIISEGVLQLSEGTAVTLLDGPGGDAPVESAAAPAAPNS
ncbi:efflux RND transporter periplasmic adaptor subunit [uncultured Devosia sp.]|uniref:efflux RND transporter periplasmic adaptor subunit n=1 Tax=uncultured Devosia sp. TaxID=211434 RepID=UPI0035CB9C6D